MEYRSTLLAIVAVALMVLGIGSFAAGELMVAGVSFLATSLTIYLREKDEGSA